MFEVSGDPQHTIKLIHFMETMANAQKIQALYEAFAQGNIPYILSQVGDTFEWTDSGAPYVPYAGTYRGRDGFADFFTKMGKEGNVIKWSVNDLQAVGNEVMARGEFGIQSHTTGKSAETDWVMIWQFQGDTLVGGRSYLNTAAIAEAFQ